MKKLNLFTLIPVLCVTLFSTASHARDITKDHPIYKDHGLYCVKFEKKKSPFCTTTKEQLTQESDYEQYKEVMQMKRLHNNVALNRLIIDTFIDNKLSVLEFEFLKTESQALSLKTGATK